MLLTGKVAVVTGASGGIGAAIALELAREGAHVALGARRLDELERVKRTIEAEVQSGRILLHKTDVTQRDQVRSLVAAAEEVCGPVDIMVNNAGEVYRVNWYMSVNRQTSTYSKLRDDPLDPGSDETQAGSPFHDPCSQVSCT